MSCRLWQFMRKIQSPSLTAKLEWKRQAARLRRKAGWYLKPMERMIFLASGVTKMVMKKKRMRTASSRKMTIQRLKNLRLMTQRITQKQKSEIPRN